MKPPWKFLAQLMSRQRPSEPTGQASEQDNDRKPVEIELQPSSDALPVATAATPDGEQARESQSPNPVEAPATDASEVDASVPASSTADGKEHSAEAIDAREQVATGVTGLAPANEPVEPTSIPPERPSKVAPKASVSRTAKRPAAADKEPAPQSPSVVSANPLFDEAANLDDDIKQLRDQLAQKLRLQNAQLRKMLERFERS